MPIAASLHFREGGGISPNYATDPEKGVSKTVLSDEPYIVLPLEDGTGSTSYIYLERSIAVAVVNYLDACISISDAKYGSPTTTKS